MNFEEEGTEVVGGREREEERGREGEGGRGGMDKRWWKVRRRQRGGKEHTYKRAYTTVGMWKRIQLMQINSSVGSEEETQKPFPGHSSIIRWNTHHTQSHAEGGKVQGTPLTHEWHMKY